jgi:hypothetical protein
VPRTRRRRLGSRNRLFHPHLQTPWPGTSPQWPGRASPGSWHIRNRLVDFVDAPRVSQSDTRRVVRVRSQHASARSPSTGTPKRPSLRLPERLRGIPSGTFVIQVAHSVTCGLGFEAVRER